MLRRAATLAVLLILLSAAATRPAAADELEWTGWRGAARDGWVGEFQPPEQWPDELERVWEVEVGTGYASPLVSNGRVYQHARVGEDEVLWCLDLETGAVVWRQAYPTPFKIGGGGERHGKGPKSSPTLSDGRIFTLSITGMLSAFDAKSGELLWRKDYGSRFEKTHPYWGASTSPLVDGDRVIVHFGTDGEGALVALDAETGDEVWTLGSDGPSYSSPIVAEVDGVRQIIEWNERALVGVDGRTGRKLWEHPFPQQNTNQNMPTPAYHDGMVLLGAENRGIHGLELNRRGDAWEVNPRWHQQKLALDMSSAVVNDGLLFGMSHFGAGRYFCLDPQTGDIRWEGTGRTGDNVAFLSIPGHVVALKDDGQLQILAADGERFEVVASYRVSDDPTWAPPVLLDDGILTKDDRKLTRWSLGESK